MRNGKRNPGAERVWLCSMGWSPRRDCDREEYIFRSIHMGDYRRHQKANLIWSLEVNLGNVRGFPQKTSTKTITVEEIDWVWLHQNLSVYFILNGTCSLRLAETGIIRETRDKG